MAKAKKQKLNLKDPKPGLYDNVPFADYLALDAASSSRLKTMMSHSPAHMKAEIEEPYEPTDAQRKGTIIHCATLEPKRFQKEYAVMPQFEHHPENKTASGQPSTSSATSYVTNMRKLFAEANKDRAIVSHEEFQLAVNIRKALSEHPFCNAVLEAEGVVEQTVIWNEPVEMTDGTTAEVLCKARVDKRLFKDSALIAADLKSTIDASPRGFEREIYKYRYDLSAAMYLSGLKHFVQADSAHFVLLAVEKVKPFARNAYKISEAALEKGDQDYRRLLRQYHECQVNNHWPMWGDDVAELSLPHYAFNEYMEE